MNAKNKYDWTPLHLAAFNGHAAVVEALLQVPGIELNIMNNQDTTPLEVAQEQLHAPAEEDLKQRLSACIALLSKPVG